MNNRFLPIMLLSLLSPALHAIEIKTEGQCSYYGETLPSAIYTFSDDNEALEVIDKIVAYTGIKRNFIVNASDVPNAAAVIYGQDRYLLYNQEFMENVKQKTNTYWAAISIMAHEIGHHLQGHTLDGKGSRPTKEIEADEYSGFVLQKMGATLEEAQAAMNAIASDTGSSTHPAKQTRLLAIRSGWTKSQDLNGSPKASTTSSSSPNENTQPVISTLSYSMGEYVGEVKDGKANGQGTFTYATGNKYVGEFKDGKYNGQGTFTYSDGTKYVGEFKDDVFNGQGTLTHADGSVKSGEWKDDKFVK